MKRLNKKGFTLIELLAVIVILALLIIVAAGRITNALRNSKMSALKTEAQKILNSKLAEVESACLLNDNFADIEDSDIEGYTPTRTGTAPNRILQSAIITGSDGKYNYTINLNANLGVTTVCIDDGVDYQINSDFTSSNYTHSNTNVVITDSVTSGQCPQQP